MKQKHEGTSMIHIIIGALIILALWLNIKPKIEEMQRTAKLKKAFDNRNTDYKTPFEIGGDSKSGNGTLYRIRMPSQDYSAVLFMTDHNLPYLDTLFVLGIYNRRLMAHEFGIIESGMYQMMYKCPNETSYTIDMGFGKKYFGDLEYGKFWNR